MFLGRGVGPQCWLSADGRGFGPVPVGTAVDWPFTIENRGGGQIAGAVSAPANPDFLILSGTGSYTLLAGQSRTVRLRFAPQSAGDKSWTVETGTDACVDVRLWGTGLAGECVVSPDTLDFGEVQVGTTVDRTFEIRNAGVGLLSGAVSEPCGDFAVVDGGGPFSLDTGQSRTVRVRWTPLIPGSLECEVSTGTSCASLHARGVAVGSLCAVEPTTLDFGNVPAGSTQERSFVIQNVSAAGVLSGTVSESCSEFGLAQGAGVFSLDPEQRHVVVLRFSPSEAGSYSCGVSLGTASCPSVQASGTAVGPICEISPSAVEFPHIRPRMEADTIIVVRNAGGGALGVRAELNCPEFAVIFGGVSASLGHDQVRNVQIRWSPTSEGIARCFLRVGPDCDSIPLTGICVDLPPVCAVSEDSLLYGIATAGASGSEKTFMVSNEGGRILSGTIASDSPEFQITEGGGPFSLRGWEHWRVKVRFHPSAAGERRGEVALGAAGCPAIVCRGFGVSYRVLAEMRQVDDIARLWVVGIDKPHYTARFGRRGTDETDSYGIGHGPGESGIIDLTPALVPGSNSVRFTLENTVCCGATVIASVRKGYEMMFYEEFQGDGHQQGVLYDRTVTLELGVE